MVKYLIGGFVGGILGYFVIYKVMGCSTGSCAITLNPYLSIIYGVVFGLLLIGIVTPTKKKD